MTLLVKLLNNQLSNDLWLPDNYLGYPSIMEIKPIIKSNIGKILNFNLEMPQQIFLSNLSGVKKWRLDEKKFLIYT